ncbi:MAG: hypothetical protein AVDCRST_MAG59-5190 [uncultured Thermomicrobiales bacterium]|uniref:Phosphatidic acid phosphatase type 2/haloperoxidase domain-containing protein n=1 Tax=uncultured Thermomicrobiales bacterium TaxID=1645740 RepID=A0A6J4VRX8_9BACT|nr:MAG: hypothetical protein AVDCRST_MAG59-5190 [uncultured Thermomicrobiales bacterium]
MVCLVLAIALSIAATRLDPFPFDVPIILIVQAPDSAVLDGLARGLSWIGRFVPMAVIGAAVVVLLWSRGAPQEAAVIGAAALLSPLNWLLKAAVNRERPSEDVAGVLEHASGLGFPSGHAFGAMLLFAVIAAVAAPRIRQPGRRAAVVASCLGLALLIGWSRVRLGAHWPSDVLGGWLWGAGMGLLLVEASSRRSPIRSRAGPVVS